MGIDRADLDRMLTTQNRVMPKAIAELEQLLAGVDLETPTGRAAFIDAYSALNYRWGEAFGTLATDWYLELRGAAGLDPAGYDPFLPRSVDPDYVTEQTVKMLDDAPSLDWFREQVRLRTDVWLKNMVRETVMQNAIVDRDVVRFARVPSGPVTCAFCSLLGSRGWVYATAQTAGQFRQYHAHCDCLIVPGFAGPGGKFRNPNIDGYDPEALYGVYKEAWHRAGGRGVSADAVAREMRKTGLFRDSPKKYRAAGGAGGGKKPPKPPANGVPERGEGDRGAHKRAQLLQDHEVSNYPAPVRVVLAAEIQGLDRDKFSLEPGAKLEPGEEPIASALTRLGHSVLKLNEKNENRVKTPDFLVNGRVTIENKSPEGGSQNTMSTQLSRAAKQSSNVSINLERTPMDDKDAIGGLLRAWASKPSVERLLVIDKKGNLLWFGEQI